MSRFRDPSGLCVPGVASRCTSTRWHCGCYVVFPWGGRADAGGRVALHATACVCHTTCLAFLQPGRSPLFLKPRNTLMDRPELVAVPCPECGHSPVEALGQMRTGWRYLSCLECGALWVADRPPVLTELTDSNPT
jgi:hypothetical protein